MTLKDALEAQAERLIHLVWASTRSDWCRFHVDVFDGDRPNGARLVCQARTVDGYEAGAAFELTVDEPGGKVYGFEELDDFVEWIAQAIADGIEARYAEGIRDRGR